MRNERSVGSMGGERQMGRMSGMNRSNYRQDAKVSFCGEG